VLTYQGFYDEALELYRQSLQSEDNTGVRMNVALTYYLKGERETADRLFQEVVAQDDSYLDLFDFLATVGDAQEFYDVGVSYLRQERYDLALAQFDEALAADAKFADAVNAKGVVLTHQGQYDEALALYERAAVIAPDETGYRVNISLIYYLKGDRKKADTLYQQIVSQDDAYDGLLGFLAEVGSADEHYRIAVSYMQQEEYDRALERLDQALRADPEMGDAYNTKAVILSNKGNYEEAYALLEEAEAQLPTHPGIRLNMAIVRYLQGRRHEAAVIYQQVIDMDDRYNGFLDFLLEEE
jgi:tetratricopeptide (TPR) repeat protein